MEFDSTERPTEFHIKVEPRQKPEPLGILLVLLAIGLALSPAQAIKVLTQFNKPAPEGPFQMALTVAQLAAAGWSVVNLVLLINRRRRFPRSMIALLVFAMLLNVVEAGRVMLTDSELWLPAAVTALVAVAIASAWITYLSLSKHVREVFIR